MARETCPTCGQVIDLSKQLDGFDEFWMAYPRKDSKGDAKKAYPKALSKAGKKEILIQAAKTYATLTKGREREYIKLPGSWLRAECWTDEQLTDGSYEKALEDQARSKLAEVCMFPSTWPKEVALKVAKEIGIPKFNTWLKDSIFRDGHPVVIRVNSDFKRDYIERHFSSALFRALGAFEIEVT